MNQNTIPIIFGVVWLLIFIAVLVFKIKTAIVLLPITVLAFLGWAIYGTLQKFNANQISKNDTTKQ